MPQNIIFTFTKIYKSVPYTLKLRHNPMVLECMAFHSARYTDIYHTHDGVISYTFQISSHEQKIANCINDADLDLSKGLTVFEYCKFGKYCVSLIFAVSLGHKIKIRNDQCCHLKCILALHVRKVKKRKNRFSVSSQNISAQ